MCLRTGVLQTSLRITTKKGYWHWVILRGEIYRNTLWILVRGTLTNSEDPDEIPQSAFCRL